MQAGAVATKGVLGDACAAGYRERSGMADGGARVPEVLSASELEVFFAGFVPEPIEPALGASMGENVEEAQELAVDAPGSAHYEREEGAGNTGPRGVGLTVERYHLYWYIVNLCSPHHRYRPTVNVLAALAAWKDMERKTFQSLPA